MNAAKPSEMELQILAVLWDKGPLTVRQIRDEMPDKKKRAYTTVLSVLQGMKRKELVDHDRQGAAHVYKPLVRRRQILRPMFRDLLRNVFGGKAAGAMQCLLDGAKLDGEELAEIKRLIEEHESKQNAREDRQ